MNPEPIRIAWQSSKAVHKFPAYQRALEEHAGKVMSPGTSVAMRGVRYEPSNLDYKCFDFLNNFQLFESVVSAEREGYDAVAVGCFFDPILEELREAVDIPVVSLAETSMHAACMLGRRFGILTHGATLGPKYVAGLIERYGLEKQAGPLVNFDVPFESLEEAMAGRPEECYELTRKAAEEAVAGGAEVILLGCGLLNLIAMRNGWFRFAGAPVLDVTGCLLKTAEMMVTLRRVSNLEVSRVGHYAKPPGHQIDETYARFGLLKDAADPVADSAAAAPRKRNAA